MHILGYCYYDRFDPYLRLYTHRSAYNATNHHFTSSFDIPCRLVCRPGTAVETLTVSHSCIQIVRNKALPGKRIPPRGGPTYPAYLS